MRRVLALVPLSIALVACSPIASAQSSPQASVPPSPRPAITQFTPAPDVPLPDLTDAEVALAAQIRNAAVDDLNRLSDHTIIEMSWAICENFDVGITVMELEASLHQTRFNDAMIAAFLEPSVTTLCPEHTSKLDDGDS